MSYSTAARALPRSAPRPVARTAVPVRLRVVAPRAGRSRAGLAVLCIAMLIGGLLTLLMLNISLSNGAYELTALQKAQLASTEQTQSLAEQVDELSAPENLAAKASDLGMVPAPNTAFVQLPSGKVVGDAATARAAPKPAIGTAAGAQAGELGPAVSTTKSDAKPAKTTTTKTTTTKTETAKSGTAKSGTTGTTTGNPSGR